MGQEHTRSSGFRGFSFDTMRHVKTSVSVGLDLRLQDIEDVAVRYRVVRVPEEVRAKVRASRDAIEVIVARGDSGKPVYGVNTGFGALAETRIPADQMRALQRNLIRSHAAGVGPLLGIPAVRAMILLRAQVLALGHSGVREVVLDALVAMLNRKVHPCVPAQGSVGASGDLAPLAHVCLVLIGEGEVLGDDGREYDAGRAMRDAGIEPIVLQAKEGLSLINGTQYITALGALSLCKALRLADAADAAAAMSIEALLGSVVPFDARLHALRAHPGQVQVAARMRDLLAESEIAKSHADCNKVQDPYSLRCTPQVHGATRDALHYACTVIEREANSVTDNPSVFLTDDGADILSGGNFHGQPLGYALDLAAIATAELANISERRIEQLVNPALSCNLTPFLAAPGGMHSGYMIAQVAAASLVSENKVLCHPASVDSIPSSANKEDHVSMASISARKYCSIIENVTQVLGIELLVAASGLDQRAPLKPAKRVAALHAKVREVVAPLTEDRVLYKDIRAASLLVDAGEIR